MGGAEPGGPHGGPAGGAWGGGSRRTAGSGVMVVVGDLGPRLFSCVPGTASLCPDPRRTRSEKSPPHPRLGGGHEECTVPCEGMAIKR